MSKDMTSNRSGGALQKAVSTAIIEAARRELAEQGFGRFSMETVARRAGVGKAALYRRWATKEAMLVWLLEGAGMDYARALDTGSLIGDLESYIAEVDEILRDPTTAAIAAHIYGELAGGAAFAAIIQTKVQPLKNEEVEKVLLRASARDELPSPIDVESASDLLMGALYWRLVLRRRPIEAEERRVLAVALAAAVQTLAGAR